MTRQKSGRIINISSRAAFSSPIPGVPPGSLAYSVAKAGILGFTMMLSGELKEYGITVNAILPSANTKLFPGTKPRGGDLPGSLTLEPDFVAPIIVYLATDEAQDVTGRYIYASGGDICIYARALKLPGDAHILIRKPCKWTIDELSQVIPPLTKLG
jgi:NAD(P)-dependent dehydrogenase (short-subunit alcohol dehydrogenase family)